LPTLTRGVARGGAEGARAPPEFGRSVNPIQTRGGRLCPSHYFQPPRIQKAIYISDQCHAYLISYFPTDNDLKSLYKVNDVTIASSKNE